MLLDPSRIKSRVRTMSGNPRTCLVHGLLSFNSSEMVASQKLHKEFGLDVMEVTEALFESVKLIYSITWRIACTR